MELKRLGSGPVPWLTDFAAFARAKATLRTVVVIFILALITIGDIYAGAALTRGKASHTAPVIPRPSYRVWAQTRVSGPRKPPRAASQWP
jgi:hypothetical protein